MKEACNLTKPCNMVGMRSRKRDRGTQGLSIEQLLRMGFYINGDLCTIASDFCAERSERLPPEPVARCPCWEHCFIEPIA